jgi:YVTN family beta-propeller protein
VIKTATNKVAKTITVGFGPVGVAINPQSSRVYVANNRDNTVSIINTAKNKVTATISIASGPYGVAVTPDGKALYVTSFNAAAVALVDTATKTVTGTIPVGIGPAAFGIFIQQPALTFVGSPGDANCFGKTVSALAKQYGTLDAAAEALGFPNVQALMKAIRVDCRN